MTMTLGSSLAELREDGDTATIAGRTFRLLFKPDDGYSINEYDSDGRVASAEAEEIGNGRWRSLRDPDTGYYRRPSGFDGSAEKLSFGRGETIWWQPHPDVVRLRQTDPVAFRKERTRITELCEFGFVGAILEELNGPDAYGCPIVLKFASLWGLEWDVAGSDYCAEIVSELFAELSSAA